MGYLCHLVHNIAGHASEAFQKSCGFDVEDLCVDVYYWFDKSKGSLKEFCEVCDSEYREIVKICQCKMVEPRESCAQNFAALPIIAKLL